tara:strand:+ start:2101 stop:2892 length:792 start_codon:yes stop_codon:yes gene_type:complete
MVVDTTVEEAMNLLFPDSSPGEAMFNMALQPLVTTLDLADIETVGHTCNVAMMAVYTVEEMFPHFSDERKDAVRIGAFFHDYGKIFQPDIYKGSRKIGPDERHLFHNHVIYGREVFEGFRSHWSIHGVGDIDPRIPYVIEMIANHHQRPDGGGYPAWSIGKSGIYLRYESESEAGTSDKRRALKGDEIVPEALVIKLCDTYDALRRHRGYKPAFPHNKSVEMMYYDKRDGVSGEQNFGKDLFEFFLKNHREFKRIYDSNPSDL